MQQVLPNVNRKHDFFQRYLLLLSEDKKNYSPPPPDSELHPAKNRAAAPKAANAVLKNFFMIPPFCFFYAPKTDSFQHFPKKTVIGHLKKLCFKKNCVFNKTLFLKVPN